MRITAPGRQMLRHGIGLLLLLLMAAQATGWLQSRFIDSLDRLIYDARLRLSMSNSVDPRIAIVDIDEKSLLEIGRWPWGRGRIASLVDGLFEHYQIRLLGFDLVLPEPDDSSGLSRLEALGKGELHDNAQYQNTLARLRPGLDYDGLLAAALRRRPVILGYYLSNEGSTSGALPAAALPAGILDGRRIDITDWRNHTGNLPLFLQSAAGAGYFNTVIDPDGSVRRVPLLARHDGGLYESFSMALARAYFNGATLTPQFAADSSGTGYAALESLQLADARGRLRDIPVDENVAAWVPYRGGAGSFAYFSAADVLARRIAPDMLRGKVIIVGTSVPGLGDLRTTPVSAIYPGMEVHANLLSGMLDQRIKQRPAYTDAVELLVLLGAGLAMIFLFPWRAPLRATAAALVLLLALAGGNLALWQYANDILPLASVLLLMAMLYVWNMSYGYFIEGRAKLLIMQRFGQYVPPELVSKMSLDPGRYSMENRKAELTVLFSDVRGFTGIAENLQPEELARLMNEYLTAMTLVIRRHGGTLDKYIGDAIVAFWGAPVEDAQHAQNAVLAALDMQAALLELNLELARKGWPALQMGIGINTGSMTVGDMGSSVRLAYTVMGDAVNLGARLEGKTADYGVGIMVGQATRAATPDIAYRELDLVAVKGKKTAVTIYQPLGLAAALAPALATELAAWHDVLRFYRGRDWAAAEAALRTLLQAAPDERTYQLYAQRVAAFRVAPPEPGWTGITRFDTK